MRYLALALLLVSGVAQADRATVNQLLESDENYGVLNPVPCYDHTAISSVPSVRFCWALVFDDEPFAAVVTKTPSRDDVITKIISQDSFIEFDSAVDAVRLYWMRIQHERSI